MTLILTQVETSTETLASRGSKSAFCTQRFCIFSITLPGAPAAADDLLTS